MEKINKLPVLAIILALIAIGIGIYSLSILIGGEWVCITERCDELAEGDEWVKQNCKLDNNAMICEFQLEGQNFRIPLSGIDNISNMVSCKDYICDSEVFLRMG